jgi:hypothetical protein
VSAVPIRTPRGRAAAYRALWQWPLRSTARLGLTAVVLFAVVVGVVAGLGRLGGTGRIGTVVVVPPSATATPRASAGAPTVGTPSVLPPVAELTPSSLPVTAAPEAALSVAARWSAAWVDHPDGITNQQWVDGLRPFTTEEYLGVLTGVDPANVPADRVTGEPRAVRVAARSVQVEVPTNALTLVVLVVSTEDGWRVAGYDRG